MEGLLQAGSSYFYYKYKLDSITVESGSELYLRIQLHSFE
ncbi:hypothetical protein V6Z11_A04G013900 [Gossypium hirsutum]